MPGWPRWRQDIEASEGMPDVELEAEARGLEPSVDASYRLTVDLLLASGAAGSVDFRIRRDEVEVWLKEPRIGEHSCGVVGREELREWLAAPGDALLFDEVMINLDRRLDASGRLALTLPGVSGWCLAPLDADRLTGRV